MQFEVLDNESFARVVLTLDELTLINNALNEICYGIDIVEFKTRVGYTREAAQKLLSEINHASIALENHNRNSTVT